MPSLPHARRPPDVCGNGSDGSSQVCPSLKCATRQRWRSPVRKYESPCYVFPHHTGTRSLVNEDSVGSNRLNDLAFVLALVGRVRLRCTAKVMRQ